MKNAARKELFIEGLDCANCAVKIEKKVNEIEGVEEASVDFLSKKMVIHYKDGSEEKRIIKEASQIAERIEKGVRVLEKNSIDEEGNVEGFAMDWTKAAKYAVGGILFSIAVAFKLNEWAEFLLYFLSYLIFGWDVLWQALKNIARGQIFDENFLMGIATVGAFVVGEYPEGVSVMIFYKIGEAFQDMAVNRSRRSIKALMDIRPDYANLRVGSSVKKVSPEEVEVGQIIEIKPGEKIPLDGEIIEGVSLVDTSALTGESLPREVMTGSEVLNGFINLKGLLAVKVSKTFNESTVSKIIELVQNSSSRKSQTESFITKFARYYTPVVVFAAAATAVIPPLFIEGAEFSVWFYRALIFLVISCPCALVVSIPLSYFGGIGGASKNGILIKGSNFLEALNNVDTVVFDKTGTLTKGIFKVTVVKPVEGVTNNELLKYAALAESHSNHPIAVSIKKEYPLNIEEYNIKGYEEVAGHGIRVIAEGKEILAGNKRLMEWANVEYKETEEVGTVIYIAVERKYAGCIVIEDELKQDSKKTIDELKGLGLKKVAMLTGDHYKIGKKVAAILGIHEFHAELLPHQKVEILEALEKGKSKEKKLVFVGDGINDAPVIARADIGVAMGGLGSDAAIEAADVVIMSDEPSKIVDAIKIAKRTKRIVWQNIVFAMGVKAVVLALGAGGIATMWEAVFADVGVALIAVLNAMRVMRVKRQ
ncbi:MAG: heavy metal translocating P-type ATPase [Clostridia bacterium]|nr:heavy metal translocating P-type ATPase [Clostridia bacterium]